jgi:hypothetical protein
MSAKRHYVYKMTQIFRASYLKMQKTGVYPIPVMVPQHIHIHCARAEGWHNYERRNPTLVQSRCIPS